MRLSGLLKQAKPIAGTLRKVIRNLPIADPGYGYVFYHPENHELFAVLSDSDDQSTHNKWHNALKAIKGITRVRTEAEGHPPNRDEWVLIKRAAAPLGVLGGAQNLMGNLTGGPSPLTNALAGSLLTGGLGYGTGWLLEHLFPERFVERGRLRNVMGLAGAGLGATPGLYQWNVNARRDPQGGFWKSLVKPNKQVQYDPQLGYEMDEYWKSTGRDDQPFGKTVQASELAEMRDWLGELPEPHGLLMKAAEALCKQSFDVPPIPDGAGGVGLRAVPMDAFNQAIWNDVRMGMTSSRNPYGTKSPWGDDSQQMHTPPQLGAATSGIATGIQDMYGGRNVLSPAHFIRGLATAGVDVATAKLVGGTLGALGGLTPDAQQKIQDVGLWGGLIRGTVGSMLGM